MLSTIRWWAKRVTSENKPKSAGVVRRIAISEHCLWVSIPRCRRASWKVVSICQRKTNHLRSAQGPQGRHQDRCTARPGWRKHLADRAPVPSVWTRRPVPCCTRAQSLRLPPRCAPHHHTSRPHSRSCPGGARILGDDRKVWEAFALQARPAQLTGSAWWGRIVERCVQAQTSNERHRPGQEAPAACKESEASVSGISHGHDLALGPPTPHQKERLTCPESVIFLCRLPRWAA
jgi:hypothetical protein